MERHLRRLGNGNQRRPGLVVAMADTVLRRLNRERHHGGIRTLKHSRPLQASATARARAMARSGRLAHGKWWKVLYRFAGRRFGHVGENIASGQDTTAEVVGAWMDSAPHRANILDPGYSHVGVGTAQRRGVTYWVTHFGGG